MSHDLPEFVYLVTAQGEWPISAIAGDHPSTVDLIEREVQRRAQSRNVQTRERVKVWRVRVEAVEEMDLMPSAVVRSSLRPLGRPTP
jgi:hypothetical protein